MVYTNQQNSYPSRTGSLFLILFITTFVIILGSVSLSSQSFRNTEIYNDQHLTSKSKLLNQVRSHDDRRLQDHSSFIESLLDSFVAEKLGNNRTSEGEDSVSTGEDGATNVDNHNGTGNGIEPPVEAVVSNPNENTNVQQDSSTNVETPVQEVETNPNVTTNEQQQINNTNIDMPVQEEPTNQDVTTNEQQSNSTNSDKPVQEEQTNPNMNADGQQGNSTSNDVITSDQVDQSNPNENTDQQQDIDLTPDDGISNPEDNVSNSTIPDENVNNSTTSTTETNNSTSDGPASDENVDGQGTEKETDSNVDEQTNGNATTALWDLFQTHLEVCRELVRDVHTETSFGMSFRYQYDVQIQTKNKKTEVQPLSVALEIGQAVQQFLLDLHVTPYCDDLQTKVDSDFRTRTLQSQGENTTTTIAHDNFSDFVLGVGIGVSKVISPTKGEKIASTIYRMESTNIVYFDDTHHYGQNILTQNQTRVREAVLKSIANAFSNKTVQLYYDLLKTDLSVSISLLEFVDGTSDGVHVDGGNNQKPTEDPGQSGSSEEGSTGTNRGLVVLLSFVALALTVIAVGFIIGYVTKSKSPVRSSSSEISSNQGSTRTVSIRTNGSRAVTIIKDGAEKSSRALKSAGAQVKERFSLGNLKFMLEKWKNRRQCRFMLDEFDVERNPELRANDTVDWACTASFDDEMGMEMILQHMELDNSGFCVLEKSTLFDRDVFANTTYDSFDAHTMDMDSTANDKVKDSIVNTTAEQPLENQPSNKNIIVIEETKPTKRTVNSISIEDTRYFMEDETTLPYDEEKSDKSATKEQSTFDDSSIYTNTRKINRNKDDGYSFLQVVLGDDGNSVYTEVFDNTMSFITTKGNSVELLSPVVKPKTDDETNFENPPPIVSARVLSVNDTIDL